MTIDTKAVAARAAERLKAIKTYEKFKLEEKLGELEAAKTTAQEAADAVQALRDEINGYLSFVGEPLLTNDAGTLTPAELIEEITEVLTGNQIGMNGKELAARIGGGVTGEQVNAFYWTEGQSTLRKQRVNGKLPESMHNKYVLATAADLEQINKDKAEEEARKASRKKSSGNN